MEGLNPLSRQGMPLPESQVPMSLLNTVAPLLQKVEEGLPSIAKPMAERLKELRESYLNPTTPKQKELKAAAQQFEAVFMQQLLQAMDDTVNREEGFMDGGEAEKTFRGMLMQETASNISKQAGRGFGLAESVYQQSILLYEKAK
jgi:flagellar protein FlgJ